MRLKIRPEDVNELEMSDWLARLRDEVNGEAGSDGTEAGSDGTEAGSNGTELETAAPPRQATEPPASATTRTPATPASRPSSGVTTAASRERTVRAVIGNELHIPIVWCEMGSCISYHTDPAALGEADIRTRALRAGWRLDWFGRLACVDCLQSNSWFRAAYPVVLWDKEVAASAVSTMAARLREDDADCRTAAAPSVDPAVESVTGAEADQWIRGRHRKQPT